MARKDRKRRSNIVSVDFSDVQSNALLPEDTGYHFKVISASHKDNDGDGAIVVKLEVLGANNKKSVGKTIQHYFNLGDSSLWVLRNFLDACGVEVPEGPLDIDLDGLTDLEFIADNEHNTYNDRTKNQLGNFLPSDGEPASSDEEDEDEDIKVTDKGKKKAKDEDDEEDEDERPSKKSKKQAKDEDEEDEDEDEEDEKPSKKSKKRARDEDEDEEDEEDEDEKPSKKSKKSKDEDDEEESSGDEYSEDEIRGMDEKELKAIIKLHKLKVDLDDYPSLRKQSMAVCDALDKKGLLAE